MKLASSVLLFCAIGVINIYSQTVNHPNSGLKSHETLEISKVVTTAQKTVIFLSVENRITGGYFCADKNIFIIYPDGTRTRLISSNVVMILSTASSLCVFIPVILFYYDSNLL